MQPIAIKDIKKARYERKFTVSEIDRHEAEAIIKSNPAMFSEIYHERFVNNLYLDSSDLESYHDNVMGRDFRLKTRVRWYGDAFGNVKKPILEMKIKNSELGSKYSFQLNPFAFDSSFSREIFIRKAMARPRIPTWVLDHVKSLNFALFNRYRRKYFISRDGKYRVTLDSDFEFYSIVHQNNSFLERIREDEYVVVELKYAEGMDSGAETITNSFPFRLTKSSKYISGMENLRHILY